MTLAISACGSESPEKALYGLAHDLEHEDITGACDRVVSSTELPNDIAMTLSLRTADTARREATFDCRGAFAPGGALDSFEFEEPRVRSVESLDVDSSNSVTAAAMARVALGGAEPVVVKLVKFEGTWRVVVDVEQRGLAYGRARIFHSRPPSVDRKIEPSSSAT